MIIPRFSAPRIVRPIGIVVVPVLLVLGLSSQEVLVQGPYPAKAGETCVVCGARIAGTDASAYLIDGQRFAVKHEMRKDLFADPMRYVGRYRPSNMFASSEAGRPGTNSNWVLIAGIYLLLGVVFAALNGQRAMEKGLAAWPWALAGFFFTLPAYWVLSRRETLESRPLPRGLRKSSATAAPTPCPSCGAWNHPAADRCSSCSAGFNPSLPSEAGTFRGRN